jgi:hypothetical protein
MRVANLLCGESASVNLSDGGATAEMMVRHTTGKSGPGDQRRRRPDAGGQLTAYSEGFGLYEMLAATSAQECRAAWAVNLRSAETDGERIEDELVQSIFAEGSAVIVRDTAALASPTLSAAGDRELDGHLLVILLLVLLAEEFLANRFYRRGGHVDPQVCASVKSEPQTV